MSPKIFKTATKGPPQWKQTPQVAAPPVQVAPAVEVVANFSSGDDLGAPESGPSRDSFGHPDIGSAPKGGNDYDAVKGAMGLDSKGFPKGGYFFGKGKGGKPGPEGGCFECGGDHLARDCPVRSERKGKGKDKGKDKDKGKKRGPTGPNLDRTRITEEPVTGEVFEWKGKYGWISPTTPIDHPAARRIHNGRIYVSVSDLVGGLTGLTVGSICQFHVFTDASGLGAEEVFGS